MQRFWRLVLASILALGGGLALAGPASAAVSVAVSASPAPAVVGGSITVSGTGCLASSSVTVTLASTVRPAASTQASGTTDGAGGFGLTLSIVSTTDGFPFVPGEVLAVGVYCTGTTPGLDLPDAIAYVTPALPAPPVVTLSVPATQIFGESRTVQVTVDPAAEGALELRLDGSLLEPEAMYWLGSATYSLPSDLALGQHELEARFTPLATSEPVVVTRTLTVLPSPSSTALSISASRWRYGAARPTATATVTSEAPGRVEFTLGGKSIGKVPVVGGKASVRLPSRKVGTYELVATYVPTVAGAAQGSTAKRSVKVTKASATAKIKTKTTKVKAKKKFSVTITVKVKGVARPTGKLAIYDGKKKIKTVSLKSSHRGKVAVRIALTKKGTHKLKVRYLGSKNIKADNSPRMKVRVR